jgi:heat shock protein HslJ
VVRRYHVTAPTENIVVGSSWKWERFIDTADINHIVVEDPNKYTLKLDLDRTFNVKADCNLASGSYTIDKSSIKLTVGPTTLAECPPGSYYDLFLRRLGEVVTYVLHEGKLYLDLWADGGQLVFVRD